MCNETLVLPLSIRRKFGHEMLRVYRPHWRLLGQVLLKMKLLNTCLLFVYDIKRMNIAKMPILTYYQTSFASKLAFISGILDILEGVGYLFMLVFQFDVCLVFFSGPNKDRAEVERKKPVFKDSFIISSPEPKAHWWE